MNNIAKLLLCALAVPATNAAIAVKNVSYPAAWTPAKTLKVGIFMIKTKNPKPLTSMEAKAVYSAAEITPDLVAEQYFSNKDGANAWMYESSYGQLAMAGYVIGWIDVDKEMTSDEIFDQRDSLFSLAAKEPGIDFDSLNVWILLSVCKSGSDQRGWTQ